MLKVISVGFVVVTLFFVPAVWSADDDGDGVDSGIDNCPSAENSDQADLDSDKVGDLCDPDRDGDGLSNEMEGETTNTNADDWDTDFDGITDYYDCEPLDPDNAVGIECDTLLQVTPPSPTQSLDPNADQDEDGIPNGTDSCPLAFNPGQQDADGDGIGDLCDGSTAALTLALVDGAIGGNGGCTLIRR